MRDHRNLPPDPEQQSRTAEAGPEPRSRSGVLGRRSERTGTEPSSAQSALRVRLILSAIFLPVFVAATVLFWYWMTQSGQHDAPSSGSLSVLALICAALTLFALIDLLVVLRRRRREERGQPR